VKRIARAAIKSPSTYAITTVYGAGVLLVVAVTRDWVEVEAGIYGLSALTLLAVLITTLREVHTVHVLVNSQRDELLARIGALTEALNAAGVALPKQRQPDDERRHNAGREARRLPPGHKGL
jgi:hypothetical protein